MQRTFSALVALAIVVAAGLGAWYLLRNPGIIESIRTTVSPPCSAPIPYTVGTIDQRFGISQADFTAKLAQAATIWNTAGGKPLLAYDPTNPHAMPVNLIYDTRQQAVQVSQKIDSTEASQDSVRAQLEADEAAHQAKQNAYANAVAAFNLASQQYAAEVKAVNAEGGADKATYERLQAEQVSLKQQQAQLEAEGQALNTEATDLQNRIAAFNAGVHQVNQAVNAFNTTVGGDFEEGQYVRESSGAQHIDIYAYKNSTELLHTMAHELGHAIGLGHNSNPLSIMFPYNKSGVTLSVDDLAALKQVCKLQ